MTKTFEAFASGDTLELRIYGPIGAGLFGDGVTADSISRELRYASPYKQVVVKLNSPGGNAFEGMTIRNILASLDCDTVAEVQGLAASAASIAAMGCKTVKMHVGTALMIHEARGGSGEPMDSKRLTQMASALEALNDGMASIYADKTGLSKADCRKMMAAETWLTADIAVSKGFANSIVGDTEDAEAMQIAASFDLAQFGYRHVPQKFLAAEGGTEEVPPPAPVKEPKKDDEDEGDTLPPSAPPVREPHHPAEPQQVSPPSAAMTAEANIAVRKRLDTMTIKLIAQAAGLQADADDSAVVAAVSQLGTFVAELKTLTKAATLEAALGAIRGLQAAAEQVPTLNAKIDEQAKKLEEQERAQLIAADKADPEGRRLTPALETFWASQPLEAFKGFLATAPHILKVQTQESRSQQQQPAANEPATTASTSTGVAVLTHNGVAFEAMEPQAKADLYLADRARYDELKRNHAERGSPRAQSQQQRASA